MNKIYTKHKRVMGDTITPISCFLNLRDAYTGVALFESSDYSSKDKSKSFICVEPLTTITEQAGKITIRSKNERTEKKSEDFLNDLENFFESYVFEAKELHALNGFFGTVAYDAIPQFETISFQQKKRFEELPEIYFSAYQYIVVFDNFTNQIDVLMNSFDTNFDEFDTFQNILFQSKIHRSNFKKIGDVKSNETDASFSDKIQRGKELVHQGEVFQLVLSRGFSQEINGDDFEVYRQLRALNPSPYMFYFEMEKARLLGTSPEAQFRVHDNLAEIHPIAGTVKRTGDEEKDLELTKALEVDEKENAEHTMLVDLARNDLNITCSDVKVEAYKKIQTFSHVIHMVSKVTGRLQNTTAINAFAGTFPAGTLSGAPKYRAMELIDELEASNRGYYGGAIGQITPDGNLNMAIIIRSALKYKNHLYYQAGAGVVLDSVLESEVQEVYNKVGAVKKAIELASVL